MKETFLGMLKQQIQADATKEVAEGKLKSPVSLDEVCERLIPKLRKNIMTSGTLKMLKITDDDLRGVFKEVLECLSLEVV